MDAELILLFENCAVRSHFCVSTRSAILSVDRLNERLGQDLLQMRAEEDIRERRVTGLLVQFPPEVGCPAADEY